MVGTREVESAGVAEKRLGVSVEVFTDRQGFIELNQSSVDNVACRFTCTMKRRTARWKGEGYINKYTLLRSLMKTEDIHLPRN